MNTALKIAAFATAVAATFGTAYGVGQSIAPVTNEPPAVRHEEHDGDQRREGESTKEKRLGDHTRHTAPAPGPSQPKSTSSFSVAPASS
ncbi:hypothetical protein ABZS76_13090 [Streptomyces sp. NPDC005562]|uniref:hypothetical protein n=1 Tax=Streptomyces sp. NPDC005562 TaxID=3154890 RepID=UPI0033AF7C23